MGQAMGQELQIIPPTTAVDGHHHDDILAGAGSSGTGAPSPACSTSGYSPALSLGEFARERERERLDIHVKADSGLPGRSFGAQGLSGLCLLAVPYAWASCAGALSWLTRRTSVARIGSLRLSRPSSTHALAFDARFLSRFIRIVRRLKGGWPARPKFRVSRTLPPASIAMCSPQGYLAIIKCNEIEQPC